MKFVLLALLIAAVIWWLMGARRVGKPPAGSPPPAPSATEPSVMVACAHCGVHLPRAEALPGPDGVFCSEAHRTAGRMPR